MKATFALLTDRQTHNQVRRLTWRLHRRFRTGTVDMRLEPHVSLKQPFYIEDLDALETYMREFTRTVKPFEVELKGPQVRSIPFEDTEYGLLWIAVDETRYLRDLHDRLNLELAKRFADTAAAFDGAPYLFHLTVAIGGQTVQVYRKILDQLSDDELPRCFTAPELAMFVYDEPLGPHGEYMTYAILPLGS